MSKEKITREELGKQMVENIRMKSNKKILKALQMINMKVLELEHLLRYTEISNLYSMN